MGDLSVSPWKNILIHLYCNMNALKFIKTFINSPTASNRCDLNGAAVCFGKGQTVHPTGRNIKRVSSKAPPEITVPCVLFASVRETKYTLSNIPEPVGNLCETNLGNDLITASK